MRKIISKNLHLLVCIAIILNFNTFFAQETCASAVAVADLTGVVCATGAAGTIDDMATPLLCTSSGTFDAFFSFVAQGPNANVSVTASVAGFRPEFVILESSDNTCTGVFSYFSGNCFDQVGNYTTITGAVTSLVPGNTYWVMITSGKAVEVTTGTLTVCVDNPAPPANDLCIGAEVTIPDGTCYPGTTVGASDDLGVFVAPDNFFYGCQTGSNPEVWYSFVATGTTADFTVTNGTMTGNVEIVILDATCTDFVYTSSCGASPYLYTFINSFTPGNTYYYTISSSTGVLGTFTTCVTTYTPPTVSGQDCSTAAILCNSTTVIESPSVLGFGVQEVDGANSCLAGGENQSKWYKFTAGNNGTLEFNIDPNTLTDDYDWAVWDVTTLGCPSVGGPNMALACNWDGVTYLQSTGMSSCADICASEPDAQDCVAGGACDPYCFQNWTTGTYTPLTLTAGNTYVLLVDNYDLANSGYTLTFGGACGGGSLIMGPDAAFTYANGLTCGTFDFTKTNQTTNSTFAWTFGDGGSSALQNPSYTYPVGGSYNVTLVVTDALGCSTTTNQTIVVPVSDAGSDITVCSGVAGSIGATDVLGYTYLWSPTTGLSSSTAGNPTVTLTNLTNAATTAIYTVTTTNGVGVCSTDAVTITINPNAIVPAQTAAICSGGTFTTTPVDGAALTTVPAGTTYSWAAPAVTVVTGGALGTNQASISGTLSNATAAASTAVYTVTPLSGTCTGANFLVTVTVNPTPTITGTLTDCIGVTTSLTGSGTPAAVTATTPWLSATPAVATVSTTGVVTGVAVGTSVITYTDNNGCFNTATVTINALPTITGTLSACILGTTQLTGSATAAAITATTPWLSATPAVATVSTTGLVTGVSAGSSIITYTNTDGCFITASVTINPNPTITGTLNVCIGSTTILTGSGTAAAITATTPWLSATPAVATVSTTGVVTGVSAGTSVITYTNNNGCTITATVTVDPSPTYSLAGTNPTTCLGVDGFITISGLTATTNYDVSYDDSGLPIAVATILSSAGGTITISGLNAGAYTNILVALTSTGCSTMDVAGVTLIDPGAPVVPPITGTLNVCEGSTTALADGTAGGVWTSGSPLIATVDPVTGVVTGVSAGTSVITYTVTVGCATSVTTTVTVTALPVGTFSYTGTPYCSDGVDPLPTFSGGGVAGLFSSTAGLIINAASGLVDLSASTAGGPYTVTNTIAAAGGCAQVTATSPITITALPVASFSYTGTPYCSNGVDPLPTFSGGGVAGTFSSTLGLAFVNTLTGEIDLSASTAGGYTVTNTIAAVGGCPLVSATSPITITALPVGTFSYTGTPYCSNGVDPSPTFSGGGVAGLFSSTAGLIINAASGTVDLSASTAGTYIVTNTIAAASGCPAVTPTSSITITTLPVGTFSYTGTPYCSNGVDPSPTFSGGGVAGTFTSTAGLIINAASGLVDLSASTAGTYTVTNTIIAASGCPAVAPTSSITITSLPVGTFSYTASPYCSNGVDPLPTFSGGGVAGTFTSTAGLIINAATGLVDLSASTGGTYTVTNTIAAASGCPAVAPTSSITVTTLPVGTFSYTASPYCSNGVDPLPTFSGGGVAGTFTGTVGLVINAATGLVDLSASTAGTFTVTNSIAAAAGCPASAPISTITITTLPVGTFSYVASPYCSDGIDPSPTFSGGGIAGTFSSTAGLVINAASGLVDLSATVAGTYTVTNTIAAAAGCPDVTPTSSITVTALPTGAFSYVDSPFCSDGVNPLPAFGVGGIAGAFASTAGLTVDAVTGEVDLSSSTPATYVVTNTIAAASGCPAVVSLANITVNGLPAAPTVSGDTTYCSFATPTDIVAVAGGGGTLIWYSDATLVDSIGTGLTLTPSMVVGTNNYYVTETVNGCEGPAGVSIQIINFCDIEIPTAFTPDGNLVNDSWELKFIDKLYNQNQVKIFNRWGNLIFESAKGAYESKPFDGTLNGDVLPVASYYFIIEYNDGSTTNTTGTVTIVKK